MSHCPASELSRGKPGGGAIVNMLTRVQKKIKKNGRVDAGARPRGASMSVIAFHEKAGRSQVGSCSFFVGQDFFLPPSRRCRHPSIRTLRERFCSLGARWAFSFQPVLPPVFRPVVLLLESGTLGQAINAVTGTRLWAFAFPFTEEVFDFRLRPALLSGRCCAKVRKLLRLPINDAATPPAFLRWR